MFKLLILCALGTGALALSDSVLLTLTGGLSLPFVPKQKSVPLVVPPPIGIVRSESNIEPDGSSYENSFETENGISAQETGSLLGTGSDLIVGFYKYTSPEGTPILVNYVADENGYQPSGDILPTPPPIPALILKGLAYNEAHPETEKPLTVLH